MTIKRRLFLSNLVMILIPVCITVLIMMGYSNIIKYKIHSESGSIFENPTDFTEMCYEIRGMIKENLQEDNEKVIHFSNLENTCKENGMSVLIKNKDKEIYYKYGEIRKDDNKLFNSIKELNNNGTIYSNDRYLFADELNINGNKYELYLLGDEQKISRKVTDTLMMRLYIIVLITLFFSIYITNKYLIKFIFKEIETSIELLSNGVNKIKEGNLDFRILYDVEDEFKGISEDFNDMAEQLKKSAEQIKIHEENRKELLAGISHDLRSPLTSIKAYVEGLLDGIAKTPENQRKYLSIIKTKAEEINHLVSQIFLFSKIDMDQYPINMEKIYLNEEVNDLVNAVKDEYKNKGLVITTKLKEVEIKFDIEQLQRIFINIISNSLKYKNKDIAHLEITVDETDNEAVITFCDDGPGVLVDDLPKLFNVFYRSDKARQNPGEGSGLGLSIISRIIEKTGGRLEAKNNLDEGLSIIIYLKKESEKWIEENTNNRR